MNKQVSEVYQHRGCNIEVIAGYSNSGKSVMFTTWIYIADTVHVVNQTAYVSCNDLNEVINASQCALMSGVVFLDTIK